MSRNILIASVLCLLFWNCEYSQGNGNQSSITKNQDTLAIKGYKVLKFSIDNTDSASFGYQSFKDDESVGTKSICLYGDYVILVDAAHNCIKRVDLINGNVTTSAAVNHIFNFRPVLLTNAIVFNDSIYVTSNKGAMYVFSEDFKHSHELDVQNAPYLWRITNDSLIFQVPNSTYLDTTKYVIITKKGIHQQKRTVGKSNVNDSVLYAINKPYKIYTTGGKWYLKNQYGILQLKNEIPQIKEYGCENIDFNDKYLVYFNSTPKALELFVYELK